MTLDAAVHVDVAKLLFSEAHIRPQLDINTCSLILRHKYRYLLAHPHPPATSDAILAGTDVGVGCMGDDLEESIHNKSRGLVRGFV